MVKILALCLLLCQPANCILNETRRFKPLHRDRPFTIKKIEDLGKLFVEHPSGDYNISAVIGTLWTAKLAFCSSEEGSITAHWHSVHDLLFIGSNTPEVTTMINPQLQEIHMDIKNKEMLKRLEKFSIQDILEAFKQMK